jgi:hypothetical protein
VKIQNWPLLMLAIEFIIENPDKYDQSSWRCGSQRCVAGWVAELSGAKWEGDYGDLVWPKGADTEDEDALVLAETCAISALRVSTMDEDTADEIGNLLFLGTLTWRDVLRNLEILARGDGIELTPKILAEIARVAKLEASH